MMATCAADPTCFPRELAIDASLGPGPGNRQVAVIDLGSNSWRLVVFTYAPGAWWKRTDELYETVRIGAGLGASGRLSEEAIDARAGDAGGVRALLPRQRPRAPTTSTRSPPARSATPPTGTSSSSGARGATGLTIEVLSAQDEAHYGYVAAVNTRR